VYFRTERLNWDKKFGYNDSAVVRLAQRHRVWKEYFKKDATGQPTTEALALSQREEKPVIYYFTPAARMGGQERYDEFWEPGRTIERDYDRAFRRAIAAAKEKQPDQVAQMFYLCHNPVRTGDPAACGAAGFTPKIGDLRYSFVNTVAEPVANGLLGYGPSSADPETGQLISGMSNTYTWGVDLYGRSVTNWILMLNNELSVVDYMSGTQVRDYISRNPAYTQAKLNARLSTIKAELQGTPQRTDETKGAWDRPSPRMTQLARQVSADKNLLLARGDELARAADQLAKSPVTEAAVLDNPDVQADLLNLLPPFARAAATKDPSFLRTASRSVLTNAQLTHNFERARVEWLSKNSITTFDFTDRTLAALAETKRQARVQRIKALVERGDAKCEIKTACSEAEAKRISIEELARQVRQQVWLATALHETGHTLNLRHNFQGSYDAINYPDKYWDSRKDTIAVEVGGPLDPVLKLPRTPNDMKAAAEGTENAACSASMHNHEYSSIMDYSGKIFTDWSGPWSKYDEAAIIFAVAKSGSTRHHRRLATSRSSRTRASRDSMAVPRHRRRDDDDQRARRVDLPLVNVTHTNPNERNYTERFHYSVRAVALR
jgi:hypothetical protein